MKKFATYLKKLYGHPWVAHACKTKIAIENLQKIV
jgi:hypothetical protein